MKVIVGMAVFGLAGALLSSAQAATVLKHEPAKGRLPAGETVLVDDGTCPRGQILQVTGGGNRSLRTGFALSAAGRKRACVKRA